MRCQGDSNTDFYFLCAFFHCYVKKQREMNFFSVNRNYAGWKALLIAVVSLISHFLVRWVARKKNIYTLFNLFIVDIAAIFHSCCDTKKSGFLNANRSNFLCLLMLLHAFRVSRIFRLPYEAKISSFYTKK